MVKGTSRQVIVVPTPDPNLFEQAIFILREDALGKNGISDREVLRQARQAAGSYLPQKRERRRLPEAVWAALGAGVTGLAWLLTMWLG